MLIISLFFLNPYFSNVTFLYSWKDYKTWLFANVFRWYRNVTWGKIWVKSTSIYQTILKFMLSGEMFDNFFLQIVKINTHKISNSCPFARISTCKEQEHEGILKIIFLLCKLTCFCCQDANLFLLLGYSISNLVDEIDYFTT